ncbi:hypothetical protein MKUB_52620 [Mycobacterium kubicae]|uniref:Transposase n=1 Tax=Mycobacterium kubicae TaxID=120959 RepID=A0ABQ1BVX9_9MYCO|nr:hypothetical protein MKUB_52620 [Mycobacterium kubicae]
MVSVEVLAPPIEPGWVARLGAAVRAEFRVEVLVPAVADPILGSPACAVPGCVRSSRYAGLCPAHLGRWRKAGRPDDRRAWAATADPEVMGYRPLQSCLVPGCGFGQHRYRLCYTHSHAWDKAGRPVVDRWKPDVAGTPAAVCAIPGCMLWAELDAGWCHSHHRRWRLRGRPSAAEFIAYCASYGEDRFDLRPLRPQLRLEIGYALQCRVDLNRTRTTPRSIKPLLDHLSATGAESLLDRPLADWLAGLPAAASVNTARSSVTRSSACSICATGPAGTANTSVTCGGYGGSVFPAMTGPNWISLRCTQSGFESWPNDGAGGACRAESGWGSYAVIASRSFVCRSSCPD